MSEMLTALGQIGLVPVVKMDRGGDAVPLGQALVAAGLRCAGLTFRAAADGSAPSPQRLPRCCRHRHMLTVSGGEGHDHRTAFHRLAGLRPRSSTGASVGVPCCPRGDPRRDHDGAQRAARSSSSSPARR